MRPAMLAQLSLRDFALVERLELELEDGMTVLTGETGAGKSILVDAVGLLLGGRAASDLVRAGATRTEVSGLFLLETDGEAAAWLEAEELTGDAGECVVRRLVGADGRSRAWINARPVPAQALRDLSACLADVHGQHAHQSLLRPAPQRALLDGYAGHRQRIEDVAAIHRRFSALSRELESMDLDPGLRASREELLRFQIAELEGAALSTEALASLDEEQRRLANAEALLTAAEAARDALAGDGPNTAEASLGAAARALREMSEVDPALGGIDALVEAARIQAAEAAVELRRYREGVEVSPERLREVETRISLAHDLARKHRVAARELPALLGTLGGRLAESEAAAEGLEALERERSELLEDYERGATALTESRREAAAALSAEVTSNMQGLGMEGGVFEVEVEPESHGEPRPHGRDRIQFLVSANPGHPPQALARVASGGELSRVSLAIQLVRSAGHAIPTLIFDEVDAGVGGRVAEMVGKALRDVAGRRQVLCVTHLPQIASLAHQHVRVAKEPRDGAIRTAVHVLGAEERVKEVARMLAGQRITERTLAHAREMLEQD